MLLRRDPKAAAAAPADERATETSSATQLSEAEIEDLGKEID